MRSLLACCLLVAACTTDPTELPQVGTVRLTVTIPNEGLPDTSGFVAKIGGAEIRGGPQGGTVLFRALKPGTKEVAVGGAASWCTTVPASQPVTVVPNDTVDIAATIHCSNVPWTVRVIVRTLGVDLDPDGYTVHAGSTSQPVHDQDTIQITLPVGDSVLSLTGAVDRCWPASTLPLTYHPAIDPGTVTMTVSCGMVATNLVDGPGSDGWKFVQLNLADGRVRPLPFHPFRPLFPMARSWSSSRHMILLGGAAAELLTFDPATGVLDTLFGGVYAVPNNWWVVGADWDEVHARIVAAIIPVDSGAAEPRLATLSADGTNFQWFADSVPPPPANLGAFYPSVSPDGATIAFWSADSVSRLMTIGADGRAARVLLTEANVGRTAWTPDGRVILFTRNVGPVNGPQAIWKIRPDGTGLAQLTHPTGTESDDYMSVSLDGTTVLFTRYDAVDGSLPLMRVAITGGAETAVSSPSGKVQGPAVFPH